jgi:hypothetical protein
MYEFKCRWIDGRNQIVPVEVDPARLLGGVTLSEIIDNLLDPTYELVYIEHSENFDQMPQLLQDCIEAGNKDPLYDKTCDWWSDAEWQSVTHIEAELKRKLPDLYPFTDWDNENWYYDEKSHAAHVEDGVEYIMEEYGERIREVIWDRDVSAPLTKMINNTSDVVFHYKTGFENWGQGDGETLKEIKRFLKIQIRDKTWDKPLQEMIDNAYYGGQLCVYFTDSFEDWVDIPDRVNALTFDNAHVALWDSLNGAGHDCHLKDLVFTIPFDRGNLGIDEVAHYNYTYSVCGMSSDWCDDTRVIQTRRRWGNYKTKRNP